MSLQSTRNLNSHCATSMPFSQAKDCGTAGHTDLAAATPPHSCIPCNNECSACRLPRRIHGCTGQSPSLHSDKDPLYGRKANGATHVQGFLARGKLEAVAPEHVKQANFGLLHGKAPPRTLSCSIPCTCTHSWLGRCIVPSRPVWQAQ